MPLELWLAFVAASSALLLIPGPTVLLVLSYALSKGRGVAAASAIGVALGDLIAMTASLLGLGALILASATLFTALKWVGAAYLVWLGIRLIRSAPPARAPLKPEADIAGRGVLAHAAAVTALNPKSIAFFIAFVPQFITPDRPFAPQYAILVATFVALAALNALVWALLADRLRVRIGQPGVLRRITQVGGAVLIGMGLMTVLMRRGAA